MLDVVRKYRGVWALALYLVSAVGLVLVERVGEERPMGPIGSATFASGAAAQDAVDLAGAGLGDVWDRYLDLVRVREENVALRADVDRLRDENTRLLGVMQQNERLRAMVGFRDAHPRLELVPARVIARDVTPWFRVTTIRLELAQQHVAVGMPVVASAGVVGYVSEVSGAFAQVTLAVDPRSSIDVLVQRNRARGVVQGLGHDDDYDARIGYLLRRDEVRPGDLLVTSGKDLRYPADLVVGRIREIGLQDFGVFQEVRVEPAVDLSRLEEVFVIVGESR